MDEFPGADREKSDNNCVGISSGLRRKGPIAAHVDLERSTGQSRAMIAKERYQFQKIDSENQAGAPKHKSPGGRNSWGALNRRLRAGSPTVELNRADTRRGGSCVRVYHPFANAYAGSGNTRFGFIGDAIPPAKSRQLCSGKAGVIYPSLQLLITRP